MDFQTYPFCLKALSPIAHGDFADGIDTGNSSLFRSIPMIGEDNQIHEKIPVISGNCLRGIMRRFLTQEFFRRIGQDFWDDTLYLILANGGALGKSLDAYVRPEAIKKTRILLPLLSVFGSAMLTYMLPGTVNVSFAYLQCRELGTSDKISSELLTDISMTRHLEISKVSYPNGVKPMPYTVEAVISGARFNCAVTFLPEATEVEQAVVFHGLKNLHTVGGKSGSGFGSVLVESEKELDDSLYLEWLDAIDDAYKEELQKFIVGLKDALRG